MACSATIGCCVILCIAHMVGTFCAFMTMAYPGEEIKMASNPWIPRVILTGVNAWVAIPMLLLIFLVNNSFSPDGKRQVWDLVQTVVTLEILLVVSGTVMLGISQCLLDLNFFTSKGRLLEGAFYIAVPTLVVGSLFAALFWPLEENPVVEKAAGTCC